MAAGDVDVQLTQPSSIPCNVFDGVDDYVEIPHNAAQLGVGLSNGFTISAWINPRSLGEAGFGEILNKSDTNVAGNGFLLSLNTNNCLRFRINNGTIRASANSSITLGAWTHLIVTVTSAQIASFYINGVVSGTPGDLVQTIAAITTTNAMRIGNRATATDRTFDGSIRSVKMWNRVLTAAEIAKDYNEEIVSNGLIHYFKLGGDYTDYGSVGVTATNSGSVAINDGSKTDIAVTTQRSTVGSIAGTYLICDVNNGTQVLTTAIDEA